MDSMIQLFARLKEKNRKSEHCFVAFGNLLSHKK